MLLTLLMLHRHVLLCASPLLRNAPAAESPLPCLLPVCTLPAPAAGLVQHLLPARTAPLCAAVSSVTNANLGCYRIRCQSFSCLPLLPR
jgi:hypothetical protein